MLLFGITDQHRAASRERMAIASWWFVLALVLGSSLTWLIARHSSTLGWFVGIVLAGVLIAPVLAILSMAPPPRARAMPPPEGQGSFRSWRREARRLGRNLLYHEDNSLLAPEALAVIAAARRDLNDTLRSHPLRDDLERVCQRIRTRSIPEAKDIIWKSMAPALLDLRTEYDRQCAILSPAGRIQLLRETVGASAVMTSRLLLPRLLERIRLGCVVDCAWNALYVVQTTATELSPVEVVAALVLEWADFTVSWEPEIVQQRAIARVRGDSSIAPAAPPPAAESSAATEGEASATQPSRRRVRVRVRKHHHRKHTSRFTLLYSDWYSVLNVFRSFGQWLRYTLRSWWLYR